MLDRRVLLQSGALISLGALLAACAPAVAPTNTTVPARPTEAPKPAAPPPGTAPAPPATATAPPVAAPTTASAATKPAASTPPAVSTTAAGATKPAVGQAAETVYAFNVGSKDVTLIDAAERQVRETRPLGAQVRWLSNEQTFWDGQRIWTYDFPENKVQIISIDPKAIAIDKSIKELGTGPAHSAVLLPGNRKAAVNIAGDDVLAIVDLPSGQIDAKIKTGKFP